MTPSSKFVHFLMFRFVCLLFTYCLLMDALMVWGTWIVHWYNLYEKQVQYNQFNKDRKNNQNFEILQYFVQSRKRVSKSFWEKLYLKVTDFFLTVVLNFFLEIFLESKQTKPRARKINKLCTFKIKTKTKFCRDWFANI